MGNLKSFMLGLFTAYGVYYLTRKGPDGKSVLDELLEDPSDFMRNAKDIAIRDSVQTVKDELR